MIDLHCHILPAVDDGPPTIEDALALAAAAAAMGTSAMVATPHVSPRYPTEAATIERETVALNERLKGADIPLMVIRGAEVAMTQLDELAPGELGQLHLGSGPWLMIESPYTTAVDSLPVLVARLQADGHRIVLAHPERCAGFRRRPGLIRDLVEQSVLTSITASALSGRFGRDTQRFCLAMAQEGLVHNVASDAHDLIRRPPGLASHIEAAGLGAYAELLTEALPRAILGDGELPAFPAAMRPIRSRRRWWSLKRA